MDIGLKLKEMREHQGLSMNELSRRSGITQSFISYIEAGSRQPTMDTLQKLCKGLGVSLLEFLGDDPTVTSLPPHLQELLTTAKDLSPNQVDQLNKFIKSIKDMG